MLIYPFLPNLQKPMSPEHRPPPPSLSNGRDETCTSPDRKRVQIHVSGMSCSSCVSKIEKGLAKKPGEPLERAQDLGRYVVVVAVGINTVVVALLSEKADIQYYPGETDPEKLVKLIKDFGFGAELIPEQEDYQQGKLDITVSSILVECL